MTCAWKELLAIIPAWMRQDVDRMGRESLQELRLRINAPPELVFTGQQKWLAGNVSRDDLNYCINAASRYSPWNAATASRGYITAPGGHRIGLCGEVVCHEGKPSGIRNVTSLCIRVARDFLGIGNKAIPYAGSVLIIGAPGWGKSTLLRDLSRMIAEEKCVSVVDERGELFPQGFLRGKRMDVLSGCPKTYGISMALRTMGPGYIAVDEITEKEDCDALVRAANCGVHLLAAAHAGSVRDYQTRSVYRSLAEQEIFETILVLKPDKTYTVERMTA